MNRIRGLEAKLKGQENSGTTNADWNLLLNLKRELGISGEIVPVAAATAGEGDIPSKAVSANM